MACIQQWLNALSTTVAGEVVAIDGKTLRGSFVIFAEDKSRVRKDHGPLNLSMLHRLALAIVRQDTSIKDSPRGKRQSASWEDQVLLTFLTHFSDN